MKEQKRRRAESLCGLHFCECLLEFFCFVGFFPWQVNVCSAEVSETGGLTVDWSEQVEVSDDGFGSHVEVFHDEFVEFVV